MMNNLLCTVFGHKPVDLGRANNGPGVTCCARCNTVLYFHGTIDKGEYPLAKWPVVETVQTSATGTLQSGIDEARATMLRVTAESDASIARSRTERARGFLGMTSKA
jgi:hypothetical protein